jgi:hypothetical protein
MVETTSEVWIPAFAGMTVNKNLLRVVTPGKPGVQKLNWNEKNCRSNYETVNSTPIIR